MYIHICIYIYISPCPPTTDPIFLGTSCQQKAWKNRREGGKIVPWSQNGPMLCAGYAPSMRLLCAKYSHHFWNACTGMCGVSGTIFQDALINLICEGSLKNYCAVILLFLLCAVRATIDFVKDRSTIDLLSFFVFVTMRRARQN